MDRVPDYMKFIGEDWTPKVKKLLLVTCASRSGSSVLTEFLKQHPEIYSLQGENNVALKKVSMTPPDMADDRLTADDLSFLRETDGYLTLQREIARDLITDPVKFKNGDESVMWLAVSGANYMRQLFRKTRDANTSVRLDPERFAACFVHALDDCYASRIPRDDWKSVNTFLLARLTEQYPDFNPFLYDIDKDAMRELTGLEPDHFASQLDVIVEEPPFITLAPSKPPRVDDLNRKWLLLKTPANVYRAGFIRALFPNAEIKVIHLTRHPGASINGLVDGWVSDGFHYSAVNDLKVFYPDQDRVLDLKHWKFDMPPLWPSFTMADVYDVAGFQWSAAHWAAINYMKEFCDGYERFRFEDIVDPHKRRKSLAALSRFAIGDDSIAELPWIDRAVANSGPGGAIPAPDRWRNREKFISPRLQDGKCRELAEEFDYDV